jgi:hypothetical protein
VLIIYIAGPFRAATHWQIKRNILRAEELGILVAEAGAMPFIPHANTGSFHGLLSEDFWLDGTLELLRRCDGVALVRGWELSMGATAERQEAQRLDMPVFDAGHDCLPVDGLLVETIRGWLEGVPKR